MSTIQTAMLCTKCKEVLNNQDDIFGTSCGHLYHFLCIRECHGRSTNCTHCEAYKPSIFKMFQEFEKAPISLEDQTKIIELHNELQENKFTIDRLEEKHKISQTTVQQLEGKLKKLNDALKGRDSTISDLEDRIATLEELNKFLSTEIEQKSRSKDNDNNNTKQQHSSTTPKNLEMKLNHLKNELEEEIAKNSQISIENFKLKSLLNLTNNENYLSNISENVLGKKLNEIVSDDIHSDEILESNKSVGNSQENSNNNNLEHISENYEQSNKQQTTNSEDNRSVVIRSYRNKELKTPLESNVIYLANKMGLKLESEEIDKIIKIKNNNSMFSLIVAFKNNKTKEEFLSKKSLLKKFSKTKNLKIFKNIVDSEGDSE